MSRKCLSSIPSSYASVYLITAFFALSFTSLLYLKYPQQCIDHFDFRVIKLNTTIRESSTSLIHDLAAPYVDALKEIVHPAIVSTTPPDLTQSSPVVTIAAVNPRVELSPPPVVNPVIMPTLPELTQSPPAVNIAAVSPPVGRLSPPPVVNITTVNPLLVVVNQTEKKPNDEADDDEDEDESSVMKIDQISFPPSKFTSGERMKWIKQKIPESKILESTPRTRKFELKMQQYVSAKRCSANIYMTWISSTSFFGKREMFSLESVINTHPHACVIIISRIMATKTGRKIIQPLLDRGHMILTVAPDFPLLFSGTPAQSWFERLKVGQLDPGKIPITQNLSNLLRLAVLYKYGGIYFDTDMIILKDVSTLRNSIGIQELDPRRKTWSSVNNAVLIFDKYHPLVWRFMEEFNSTFDGSSWGHNGPYMATRIIKKILGNPKYQFDVMSPVAFYPVDWRDIHKFFRNTNVSESSWDNYMFQKVSKESYGVHLWNKISRDLRIEKGSIIGKLISTHCIICQDIYGS